MWNDAEASFLQTLWKKHLTANAGQRLLAALKEKINAMLAYRKFAILAASSSNYRIFLRKTCETSLKKIEPLKNI
jgi:hypothetical protein